MNPILVNLLTFLAGLLIGNWQAVGRDKRKEFNELADPIRHRFEKEAASPSIYNKTLADDVALLRHHMPRRQQAKYDKAMENYKTEIGESNQSRNTMGEVFYTDRTLVTQAAQAIVNLLHRR